MKFQKIIKFLTPLTVASTSATLVGCANNTTNDANINDAWDNLITINNGYINPGFHAKKGEKQLEIEQKFLDLLSQRFNELKNKDPLTKDLADVKFNINVVGNKDTYISKLKGDQKDNDLFIANYTVYDSEFLDENNEFKNEEGIKLVAQTATLKFNWQSDDNDFYTTGLKDDKLRQAAEKNNIKWVKDTGFEYPDWEKAIEKWKKNDEEDKLKWDDSKFAAFYEKNALTYVYHGAILIAGDKAKRDQIIEDWEAKDWDKFVQHGIAYKEIESAGRYKYQIALLARHFNKSIEEIKTDLEGKYARYVVVGKGAKDQLGKASTNITPAIGFDDEGVYNWTRDSKNKEYFKPTGFQSYKAFDDADNKVVRTLTLTNPAAYDVVLGRKGLSGKQVELIQKALNSLSLEENTYGIFTGYNKFLPIDKELFIKFLKLQRQAQSKIDLVTDIPKIIN